VDAVLGLARRSGAVVGAAVYAPQSAVVVASRARVTGSLLARTVTVGARARVVAARAK